MSIEQYNPAAPVMTTGGANLIREAAAVMVDAHKLATAVASTQMIPKHFQGKPDECAAAMLYGASLGLDPMQSVRQIYVVHGQAALYARAMVALVMGAGHEVWTVESTDKSVTVAARRRGSEHVEQSTWTFERANMAGYTNNSKYKTDPQAMLYSKAASEVCRKIAPDVLSGVYAVEELQMERVESERVDRPAGAVNQLRAALNSSPAQGDVVSPEPVGSSSSPATESGVQASAGEDPEVIDAEPMFDYRSGWAKWEFFPAIKAAEAAGHFTDKAEFMSEVVGRGITSSKELTEAEAQLVLAHLPAITAEDAFGEPSEAGE